nr:MAG TPA: hypothetical protein [Caudoviricetes sp.]
MPVSHFSPIIPIFSRLSWGLSWGLRYRVRTK